jgi:magnesium transporter
MYRLQLWSKQGKILASGDETLLDQWRTNPDSFLWLDAVDNEPKAEAELLKREFKLHPLAISDAQRQRHPPKLEVFTDTWFVLLKELASDSGKINFATSQLAIFAGARFMITRRSGDAPSVEGIWQHLADVVHETDYAPAQLSLNIAKQVADRYVQLLLDVEHHLEELEEEMFEKPNDMILSELVSYQTHLRKMIRFLSYHKQIFDSDDLKGLPGTERDYIHEQKDVYEHSERGFSLASLYYQNASDLIDGYISVASHRLNQIMKVLTVITVIFVPLSFIAGIYGMNFENMPELKSKSGYFILLGTMFLIATTLLLAFKRKKWL